MIINIKKFLITCRRLLSNMSTVVKWSFEPDNSRVSCVCFQSVAPVVLVRVLPARREHGVRVRGRAPAPARAHAHAQAPRAHQRAARRPAGGQQR